ncbi:MAG: S41 family peptidase [Flavitalea sp.]
MFNRLINLKMYFQGEIKAGTALQNIFPTYVRLLFFFSLMVLASLDSSSQSPNTDKNRWKKDIKHAYDFIASSHKNPYHTLSKKAFDSSFNNLHLQIDKLNQIQIITELGRIIASIGDGHTRLQFFRPEVQFHLMPIRLYQYEDGVFIQAIDISRAWAVGAEVLKIGKSSVNDAVRRLSSVTSADNFLGAIEYSLKYASIPELLYGLKISEDSLSCSYTIRAKDGSIHVIRLQGETMPSTKEFLLFEPVSKKYIKDRDKSTHPTPEYLQATENLFSLKVSQDEQLLYLQVNEVRNDPTGFRLTDFFANAIRVFDSAGCKRMVLDLRLNRGGDASLLKPIIHLLVKHPVINKRGNFFVIIGRRTFSAAGQFVTELADNTTAILVGEPSGTGANRYGETGETNLPNCGVRITISTQWIQRGRPEDKTRFFGPELFAPLTSLSYRSNIDPSLEIIKGGKYDTTVHDRLLTLLESDTITLKPFKTLFKKLATNELYKYFDFETAIQRLAYYYIRKNKYWIAKSVLASLTEYRTVTSDTYEILASIYAATGDNTKQSEYLNLALRNATGYQQFNIKEQLRIIKEKPLHLLR